MRETHNHSPMPFGNARVILYAQQFIDRFRDIPIVDFYHFIQSYLGFHPRHDVLLPLRHVLPIRESTLAISPSPLKRHPEDGHCLKRRPTRSFPSRRHLPLHSFPFCVCVSLLAWQNYSGKKKGED